jgi:hypothetical protein
MVREYAGKHRVHVTATRKPYVVVRKSARHAVSTVRDGV